MAKKVFLLFLLALAAGGGFAQDKITRSDGTVIGARVLEVRSDLILFRLLPPGDTGVYQISTRDVRLLNLADGSTKTFPQVLPEREPFNYETSSGRNIGWFSPFDLLFGHIGVGYEHVLPGGKLSFKVPLVLGLSAPGEAANYSSNYRANTRYFSGLEVNIHPFGQGRFRFFVGPAFYFASYWTYFYPGGSISPERHSLDMRSFALKNGLYYQFSRHFIVSGDIGLGRRTFRDRDRPDQGYYRVNRTGAYVPGNVHLGFRF